MQIGDMRMGHIQKILAKTEMKKPAGWNPDQEDYNLPFTVELKEDFHIHWQDIRIEMAAEDFSAFAGAVSEAHKRWIDDGRPKKLSKMKRYGWWPGEDKDGFFKERYESHNKRGEPCHHVRVFPRTESGKLFFDNVFQIELQEKGQLHIHYKNFRWELGENTFKQIASAVDEATNNLRPAGKKINKKEERNGNLTLKAVDLIKPHRYDIQIRIDTLKAYDVGGIDAVKDGDYVQFHRANRGVKDKPPIEKLKDFVRLYRVVQRGAKLAPICVVDFGGPHKAVLPPRRRKETMSVPYRYSLYDGAHRLAILYHLGHTNVPVKVVSVRRKWKPPDYTTFCIENQIGSGFNGCF